MTQGIIRSPEQGRQYRIRHADGHIEEYIFEGFGEFMKQIWRNAITGEIVTEIPPYIEHEKL